MFVKKDVGVREAETGLILQFVPPVTVGSVKEAMLRTIQTFGAKDVAIAIVTFLAGGEASALYRVIGAGDKRLGIYDSRSHLSIVEAQVGEAIRRWHYNGKLPVEYVDTGEAYLSAFASCNSDTAAYNIAIAGLR